MIELKKLQIDKQSADKLCTPKRYQPPPMKKKKFMHCTNLE